MYTYLIIAIIIGIIFGFIITRGILSKQFQNVIQINQEAIEQNNKIQTELIQAQSDLSHAYTDLEIVDKKRRELKDEIFSLTTQITQNQKEANEAIEIYYQKAKEAAAKNIQFDIEKMENDYFTAKQDFEKEYKQTMADATADYQNRLKELKSLVSTTENLLTDLQAKTNAAIEENKRRLEETHKKDFYRLNISEIDFEEIKHLRSVTPYLRNSEPLNKVIWKVYYERPYTDLIGRVIGSGIHTGIYKITNIKNGMCYVGQAVNIADRWKQHIKRGIGADPPTRNKLYPAMINYGVENFTFEIIEECERTQLNEKEIYWQNYFKAKEFGYSIK